MKQSIILIQGPSCSWKTTLINGCMNSVENCFLISRDVLKRCISKYELDNPHYEKFLKDLMLVSIKQAIEAWFSILIEWQTHIYDDVRKEVKQKNLTLKHIYIETEYLDIQARFNERKLRRAEGKEVIYNLSEERLKKIYDYNIKNKPSDAMVLNSSQLNKQEMLKLCLEYIHN